MWGWEGHRSMVSNNKVGGPVKFLGSTGKQDFASSMSLSYGDYFELKTMRLKKLRKSF